MKTKGRLLLMLISLFPFAHLFAQSISPAPGNFTVCPGESMSYTLSTTSNCTFVWTVTNGKFSGGVTTVTTTNKTVDVTWDDVALLGTLTVKCSGASSNLAQNQYVIKSLTGLNLANPRTYQILPYCSTASIDAAVDRAYVPNTGANGVNQQMADGYEWTLPTGWSSSGMTGTFQTTFESITVTPSNGCVGGTITVKAFVSCPSGYKYSNSASISLDRASVGTAISVPPGYTGSKCGDTNGVTFTATSISCASNYRWTATATGWADLNGAPGPWTTLGNTITLYPKGNSTDQGTISVDISLACGTLTQTRNISYSDPALPTPVIQTSSTSLLCSLGSGTVSISTVAGAQSYTWYSQSTGTVYINGVAHPSSSPLTAAGTSVTVSLPSLTATTGYRTDIYVSAVNKPGCTGSAVASQKVWAGVPKSGGALDISLNPSCVGQVKTGQFSTPADGYSSMTQIPDPYPYADVYGGDTFVTIEALQATPASSSFTFRYTNSCGNTDKKYAIVIYDSSDPRCGGGALTAASDKTASIFPNPASETLVVTYNGDLTQSDPKLTLFDDQQNVVYQATITGQESAINVSKFKKGIYYLRIANGEKNEEHRIVIEK